MAMARAKAVMMLSHTGQPQLTEVMAMTMPAKPIIEPTERSNSPAIINRQAPTAIMTNWAETVVQVIAPSGENMPVSRAMAKKNMKTRIVPAIAPSSGRIIILRKADISFTRSSSAAGPGFSTSSAMGSS